MNITCTSKGIEDYIDSLKERTNVAIRNLAKSELKVSSNGGTRIVWGDKEMKITKSKKDDKNLSINITKLMYGDTIVSNEGNILLEDYERGNHILYNYLLASLKKVWGESGDDISLKELKPIKDAIRTLNKRARQNLGTDIFDSNDEGLKLLI